MPDSSRKKTKPHAKKSAPAKHAPARPAVRPKAKAAPAKAAVKPAPPKPAAVKPPVVKAAAAPPPAKGAAARPPLTLGKAGVPQRPATPGIPPAAGKAAPPALGKGGPAALPVKGAPPAGAAAAGAKPMPGKPGEKPARAKKGGRKAIQRRGPDGELLAPGELLLPSGPTSPDEIQYMLRGCVAAEHAASEVGVNEIILKKGPQAEGERRELMDYAGGMAQRFDAGPIEPLLPLRAQKQRNFLGVVERAKHRRREIGAFLRGLDLGKTEISHMDSHGEASMQSLMEWAARLEVLSDADEPEQADYTQFLRVLDQLDATTESLIVDVELTLRRLRDRVKTSAKH